VLSRILQVESVRHQCIKTILYSRGYFEYLIQGDSKLYYNTLSGCLSLSLFVEIYLHRLWSPKTGLKGCWGRSQGAENINNFFQIRHSFGETTF
jgi:hypothetical protein